MDMITIIEKKKRGVPLDAREIEDFVAGVTKGTIPDYQTAALLMAICLKGMDADETSELTRAMMRSGKMMDFSALGCAVADKHSTGGVGDTTTLILLPLCACLGVKIAKMSGRGLGHTGGTIDKLEAIPGFDAELSVDRFQQLIMRNGAAITGQSEDLAPADKKLYALRDVTGTVDSIALIASSIMSKKLASGTDIIALDVKAGNGAFMQRVDDAFMLAKTMGDIGTKLNKRVAAVVTDMSQPLGNMVGNALEVREAIEILQGKHVDGDLRRVSVKLCALLLRLYGVEADEARANALIDDAIASGKALESLAALIAAQGGDAKVCEDVRVLGQASSVMALESKRAGLVAAMDTAAIGYAAQRLGAGRATLGDMIDPLVGVEMRVRIGDAVEVGQPLAFIHANDGQKAQDAANRLLGAIDIGNSAQPPQLIYGEVTA
jgi:pyrimidine-nucleoside phosphorylase